MSMLYDSAETKAEIATFKTSCSIPAYILKVAGNQDSGELINIAKLFQIFRSSY